MIDNLVSTRRITIGISNGMKRDDHQLQEMIVIVTEVTIIENNEGVSKITRQEAVPLPTIDAVRTINGMQMFETIIIVRDKIR